MSAIQRSQDHQYTFDGKTYPGVTGTLKVLDKSDALMSWAARNTAEAAIALAMDHEPVMGDRPAYTPSGLDKLLETVGTEGTVKALTSRSSWKRDEAAGLGTEVHALAEMIAHGQDTGPLSPTTRERVEGYAAWWATAGWTVRATEALLVNTSHGFGGTLDLLARDRDGRTVLADVKTGKAVYHEAVLQLAAYSMAEYLETSAGLFRMPDVDRFVILHVTAEGTREIEVSVGAAERVAFVACLSLSAWRQTLKGRSL